MPPSLTTHWKLFCSYVIEKYKEGRRGIYADTKKNECKQRSRHDNKESWQKQSRGQNSRHQDAETPVFKVRLSVFSTVFDRNEHRCCQHTTLVHP